MRSSRSKRTIRIFTDGAVLNNGTNFAKGGYAVFFGKDDPRNFAGPLISHTVTNNRAELMAVIKALEIILIHSEGRTFGQHVEIYSDSMYTIDSITKWIPGWKRRGWIKADRDPVENMDLMSILDFAWTIAQKKMRIRLIHSPAHRAPPRDKKSKEYLIWYGNHMADRMAVKARDRR
jgi:ribonuclease HI